jgi:hypothetical protein
VADFYDEVVYVTGNCYIGSGNHYVDLFTDELDRAWIGVHFGSRGLATALRPGS